VLNDYYYEGYTTFCVVQPPSVMSIEDYRDMMHRYAPSYGPWHIQFLQGWLAALKDKYASPIHNEEA
jgi:hypothetical protein